MNKNNFFVLDGTDGSGKGTQIKILEKALKEKDYNVLLVDFPQYGKKSASLVEEYLNGKFGKAKDVTAYQASIFYAVDRFDAKNKMKKHLENGGIIISNRYTTSSQIHQAGKIVDEKEREKFLNWVEDLEYNIFGIPKPSKVFFLDVPPKKGQELVGKKEIREYINNSETYDIHEKDLNHMEDAYKAAHYVKDKFNWEHIVCLKENDEMRSIDDIHKEILEKVLKFIK